MTRAAVLPTPQKHNPDEIVLPRSLEAEKSLLGAALISDNHADYISDKLTANDFFRRDHQMLFEAIRALRSRGCGVDLRLIEQQLGKKKFTDAGGPAYIASLADGVPTSTNVPHYVELVRDLHAKRALYRFASTTMDHVAENAHGADQLLQDADRRLMELHAGHLEGRVQPLSETGPALMSDLEWRVGHAGELIGLDTGYPSINSLTWGWQPGDLTVFGARPSIGKTTLLLNTAVAAAKALHAAGRSDAVLLFSFEMRRKQLEYRILSSLSAVPLTRLLGGVIMSHEWANLSAAVETMASLPIEIDDQAGQTRLQIRSTCRRVKAERGLALIGVDYVQLIPGSVERRGATRNEEITDISRGMKELADELGVPILLLSQLSRPGKFGGKDPEPKLTDLRESGSLEQDADNVGLLHRKNHRAGGPTKFILAKQRNGPTGTVILSLDRDVVMFTDGGEVVEEEKPEPAKEEATAKKLKGPKTHRDLYPKEED